MKKGCNLVCHHIYEFILSLVICIEAFTKLAFSFQLKKQLSNGVLPKPEDILPVVKERPSEDQVDSEKNG